MKQFSEWMATGPLAGIALSEQERRIAQIAYNEGAVAANDVQRAALERILQGQQPQARAS